MTCMKPLPRQRTLWKAACRLHARLAVADDWRREAALPEVVWLCCHATYRRIEAAARRGWQGAVRALRREAHDDLTSLIQSLETARDAIDPDRDVPAVVSAGEIYQELLSLADEFPEVHCDLPREQVSVVTDPIELQETFLGAFEIRLQWNRTPIDYAVVACDPQPAARIAGVTHPLVDHERLCEGDGRLPIRRALQQGRLAEFFIIVRQVLLTYNPGSAHVALDEWRASDCPECGGELPDDASSGCASCGESYCRDCLRDCAACGVAGCGHCQTTCAACVAPVCHGCLTNCELCHETLCIRCRDAESCATCRAQEVVQQPAATESTDPTGTAVHAVRVDEVVVPA